MYCKQGNHCKQGMVFAINPADKFAVFQAAAMGNSTNSTTGNTTTASPTPSSTLNPNVTTISTTVTISGQPHSTVYGSFPGSAAPTAVAASVHVISVGKAGSLAFDPPHVQAQVGDTLVFQFLAKNHTVTQSSFADPCVRLGQNNSSVQPGFDSGL